MLLEEELKTKKFKNEAQKAHLNIFFTAAWLKGKLTTFFKQFGMTMEQYNVMRIIRGAGEPIMVKDITVRMIERNSNTTRIIDRLEKKEFVQRVQSKHDRRIFMVSLLDAGVEIMAEIDKALLAENPHQSKLSMEKYQQLNEILDELRTLDEAEH